MSAHGHHRNQGPPRTAGELITVEDQFQPEPSCENQAVSEGDILEGCRFRPKPSASGGTHRPWRSVNDFDWSKQLRYYWALEDVCS